MDRCLKGEFGRWDRRHSKQDQIIETLLSKDKMEDKEDEESSKEKINFTKPEILIPAPDPLSVHFNNVCNVYSHSAPNSPLNRRNHYSLPINFNSDEEEEYELENEELSDKTNDEEENDTSGSSNSDTVTIRLHPPTPKVRSIHGDTLNVDSYCCEKLRTCNTQNVISLSVPSQTNTKTEHLNGHINFRSSSSSSNCSNKQIINSLANGTSFQSVSQASTSPVPDFLISSEGELTLEETDDTLEDVPRDQQMKLRRPNQLQSHYRFNRTPSPSNQYHDSHYKSKRTNRNTFRIHRGKDSVKHILSSKTASNERKASKVLGIIFIVFVILWTPFFAVNIINAACETCMDNFNKELMSLFLWMGYIASLANPIIYTMFNTAFRRAFIKILTCKIRRSFRSATCESQYMSYTTMLASERRNTVTVVLRDESR
ncbi:unnamed protein product [Candidula unifasciata]|uniref:G-protein coupled receptors family 1 profile domain-containing protein n=1 Tax=Candidula unifasciata TaxID=100452 RepID=A0A8S3ZEB8_9EUPU|nr:unnamed protein product [Candidula unifasciata]